MGDFRHQVESLSAAEKVELLDAVWESLETDALSLTEAQCTELDYRVTRHEQNPSDVIPWEQVQGGPVQETVMHPVVWVPAAEADLREARTWYEDIRLELGDHFALAVDAAVEAIAKNPLQFPAVYRGRRRAGVRRFPYGIFYEVQEHRIVVIACFHARRDPKRWQSR